MSNPDPRREIRRQNAKKLAASVGGQAEFGRKVEMSDSQVTQNLGDKPTKNIGNIIARRIEKAFGKPVGWLDLVHGDAGQPAPALSAVPPVQKDVIPQFYIDPDEIDIINSYRQAKPIGQRSIRAAAAAAKADAASVTSLLGLGVDHES